MATNSVTAVLFEGLSLLRCFVGTGIPTVVVSPDPRGITSYSRYCSRKEVVADPLLEPEKAVRDLVKLGQTFSQRPVVFYGDDPTLLFISRYRAQLGQYYRFLLPEPELVEDLVDKTRFSRLADSLGLPVPRTFSSREVTTAEQVLSCASLPCVLKPNSRVGWFESRPVQEEGGKPCKVLRADSASQLKHLYAAMKQFTDDFVIQEYVEGTDRELYSFHAYLDRNSEVLGYYVGRKIRTYPKDTGVSTYLELVKEPELIGTALDILKKLQWVGIVKADFKKDVERGRFYLLEINARFNLWNHLGAACGVNLPRLAYADLVGLKTDRQTDYRVGVRWLSWGNDVRTFLRDYRRDGVSWGDWLRSYRGEKIYDVFCWRDPLPLMVGSWRYAKALSRRLARQALG